MTPLISIVIPVGPSHAELAPTALASCEWQTVTDWEALFVNDSDSTLPIEQTDRVRILDMPALADGARRSSVARNVGIEAARGIFTVFLDADDYLLSTGLETLLRGHVLHDAAYSYGGHYGVNRAGMWAAYRSPEYNLQSLAKFNIHPITALVPTECLREVNGFDEGTPGLEDWTIWLRMAQAGHCGQRVHGPTFVYRRDEGINHIPDVNGGKPLMDAVRGRYETEGEVRFMGCGCGGNATQARNAARAMVGQMEALPKMEGDGLVTLEYTGKGDGKQHFTIPSQYGGGSVAAGRGAAVRYVRVPALAAEYLVGQLGFFQRAAPAAPFSPPPGPRKVAEGTVAESAAPTPVFAVPEEGKASEYPGRGRRKA